MTEDEREGMLTLEQPIIEALWNVVHRPVGGTIEDYAGDERIGVRVSPEVAIIHRIRAEYAAAKDSAFVQLVDRLGLLVESLGAKPTATKWSDEHGSAFTTLVNEVRKTAPTELEHHVVRDGDWGPINQATYRVLTGKRKPLSERPELRGEPVSLGKIFAEAEHELNLKPAHDASWEDRIRAIQDAMKLDTMKLYSETDSPPAITAGFGAMSAYRKAAYDSRYTGSYGVQWAGPDRKWSIVAYGVTPPLLADEDDDEAAEPPAVSAKVVNLR